MEFFAPIVTLILSIIAIGWGIKNNLFDEDVKYLVFDKNDKDKMTPAEFEKAMRVNKEQEKERIRVLSSRK